MCIIKTFVYLAPVVTLIEPRTRRWLKHNYCYYFFYHEHNSSPDSLMFKNLDTINDNIRTDRLSTCNKYRSQFFLHLMKKQKNRWTQFSLKLLQLWPFKFQSCILFIFTLSLSSLSAFKLLFSVLAIFHLLSVLFSIKPFTHNFFFFFFF